MATTPINEVIPFVQYTAAFGATDFAFTWWIGATTDLDVYVDGTLQSSGYTVSGVRESSGGTVTFDTAMTGGEVITLQGDFDIQRLTGYSVGGALRADELNLELSTMYAIMLQLKRDIDRTIRLSDTSTILASNVVLPDPEVGSALGWASTEGALQNIAALGATIDSISAPSLGVGDKHKIVAIDAAENGLEYLDHGTSGQVLKSGGPSSSAYWDDEQNIPEVIVHITGEMKVWPASVAPSGFVLCDGSALSRTIYSGLFSVIGDTYGAGDGVTTFNVPDMRGRVAVGVDNGAGVVSSNNSLGDVAGAETHTLDVTEIPAHTHSYTAPTNYAAGEIVGSVATGRNSGTLTTGSTGGGAAHNNMQPYVALNWIIKT